MNLTNSTAIPPPVVVTVWNLGIDILLILMIVLTLGGNAITFLAVLHNRQLRYSPYYLLLSLCVADFMVGFIVIPVSLGYNITGVWIFGSTACDVFTFSNLLFGSASILSLCAISWDRYVVITSPLTYPIRMRDCVVWKILLCCWTVSASLSGLFTYFIKISKKRTLCTVRNVELRFTIPIAVISYVFPVAFLFFVNAKIARIARRQLNRINVERETGLVISYSDITMETVRSRGTTKRIRAEIKTLKMFFVVTGTFCVCWTPFFVVLVLNSLVDLPTIAMYLSLLLAYFNSVFNPFLYGIFNKDISTVVWKMLMCTHRRLTAWLVQLVRSLPFRH